MSQTNTVRFLPLFALSLIASGAGCLVPNPPDGAIRCHPRGNTCPDGYSCALALGTCFKAGPSPADASPADAPPILDLVSRPDGAATCADYCNCISEYCASAPGTFADEAECLSACPRLSPVAFDCRNFHCKVASVDPATHCPHALGKSICH